MGTIGELKDELLDIPRRLIIRSGGSAGRARQHCKSPSISPVPSYRGLESQAVSRALKHLQLASIVHRSQQTRAWEIDDPLLAAYIREEIAT